MPFAQLLEFLKTLGEDTSVSYAERDPRKLQAAILADVRSGKLRFTTENESVTNAHSRFYRGINCNIEVQVDETMHSRKIRTHRYIRVQGKEYYDDLFEPVIDAILEAHRR